MDLNDRVAVITGATGALGAIVTRELAARGTALALLDKDPARLEALAESLSLPKSRLFTECVNLLNQQETKSVAQAVMAKFGRIDILLHVVGGWTGGKSLLEAACRRPDLHAQPARLDKLQCDPGFCSSSCQQRLGPCHYDYLAFAARPNARGGPYAIGKAGQEALMLTLSAGVERHRRYCQPACKPGPSMVNGKKCPRPPPIMLPGPPPRS